MQYYLDPEVGKVRRRRLRSQVTELGRRLGKELSQKATRRRGERDGLNEELLERSWDRDIRVLSEQLTPATSG
jgi:predicted nucleic acid-binding protein